MLNIIAARYYGLVTLHAIYNVLGGAEYASFHWCTVSDEVVMAFTISYLGQIHAAACICEPQILPQFNVVTCPHSNAMHVDVHSWQFISV